MARKPPPMMSLEYLGRTHDGHTAEAFAREMARIVEDCRRRPHLDKPRSLTLQIDVRPLGVDPTGDLVTVDYETRIKAAKLPNFEPPCSERAQVQKNGQLLLLFEPGMED